MITFPYAARVLLPEGIGVVNFQLSIINYIVLLTSLGIPLYAVKEIAKYRDDKALRDRVAVEIISLATALCIFGYIAVWLLAKYVPQIHQQTALFYILSLTILFTTIGVNWFYQGIEDFKFITMRAIAIRTLSAVSLFLFVKNQSDILIYGLITVGSTVGNNFVNFVHLRKHIDMACIKIKELQIMRHLRPALHIFVLNLIISLYVHLNSIMLGFMKGDDAVGYFTAGTKIGIVCLTLIYSIGSVMLPRCSNLVQKGDDEGFAKIITKSARLTFALAFPMVVGLLVLAAPLTIVFCGPEYLPSIPVLYLNAPVILIIGLTNVMGIQVLYPKNKVNMVIWSVSGGAVMNIILNFLLVPHLGATGAAISTLSAETTVFTIQLLLGHKYFPFKWRNVLQPKYFIAIAAMAACVFAVEGLFGSDWLKVAVGIAVGATVYASVLYALKDDIVREAFAFFLKRFKPADANPTK